jgi:hypothetical protein
MIPIYSDANLQTMLRSPGSLPTTTGSFASTYRLDSTTVDYALARKLYYNQDPRYKLGAGFARPAIDVPAGFMGVPILTSPEELGGKEQEWLNRSIKAWAGKIMKAHKMVLRDGEVLVRLNPDNRSPAYAALFGDDDKDLGLTLIPTEAFEIISMDEDLEAIEAVKIKHVFLRPDSGGNMREVTLFETITADEINLKYENDEQPERTMRNPMGFVPAVRFENEDETGQLHASSELEPVEPYLKFYHDVMLHAGSASQLHSTAKLIIRARDIERFLKSNFTDTEITEKRLRFKNKDVLFFESGEPSLVATGSNIYAEGADIIQASAPLGDTTTLLEFIFLNIVDVTEIPEWAFGGAIASSKASVGEQSSPLVHKVTRKRAMVENGWALIGRMMLKAVLNTKTRIDVEWDTLGMRDLKTEAEAFRNFAESFIALNDAQIVSKHTINAALGKLINEIQPYDLSDSQIESDKLEVEVAEKMAKAQATMDAQQEQLANEDRQTGIDALQ